MTGAIALSIDVYADDGVPVLRVAGLPGCPELWATVDERGTVRALWRVRGIPARLPEAPLLPGCPSLAALCRGALN
ncbi:hypothetical protein [Azospirillum sp. A39]|uniref:hypothetical protein n=1 Tax=Azospirillum sp. A39 TaxID=3462279 RepID=UPI0040467BF1